MLFENNQFQIYVLPRFGIIQQQKKSILCIYKNSMRIIPKKSKGMLQNAVKNWFKHDLTLLCVF